MPIEDDVRPWRAAWNAAYLRATGEELDWEDEVAVGASLAEMGARRELVRDALSGLPDADAVWERMSTVRDAIAGRASADDRELMALGERSLADVSRFLSAFGSSEVPVVSSLRVVRAPLTRYRDAFPIDELVTEIAWGVKNAHAPTRAAIDDTSEAFHRVLGNHRVAVDYVCWPWVERLIPGATDALAFVPSMLRARARVFVVEDSALVVADPGP